MAESLDGGYGCAPLLTTVDMGRAQVGHNFGIKYMSKFHWGKAAFCNLALQLGRGRTATAMCAGTNQFLVWRSWQESLALLLMDQCKDGELRDGFLTHA